MTANVAATAEGPRGRALRGMPVVSGVSSPARARARRRAARTLSVSTAGRLVAVRRVLAALGQVHFASVCQRERAEGVVRADDAQGHGVALDGAPVADGRG